MSTIKEKCKDCWVESVDENSVCYAGKHRIHYCSLHDAAPQLQKALKQLHYDCTASDFNEHWESYKEAEQVLISAQAKK